MKNASIIVLVALTHMNRSETIISICMYVMSQLQTIPTRTHPLTFDVCILMWNACWLSTLTASSSEYARNDVSGRTGSVKMDTLR